MNQIQYAIINYLNIAVSHFWEQDKIVYMKIYKLTLPKNQSPICQTHLGTLQRDSDSRHQFVKVEKGQFNVTNHTIFRKKSLPSRRNTSPAWSTEGQRNRIFSLVIFSHFVLHWIHTKFKGARDMKASNTQKPISKTTKIQWDIFFSFRSNGLISPNNVLRDSQIPAQRAQRPSRKLSTCFSLRSAEARAILLPPVDAPRSSASSRPH